MILLWLEHGIHHTSTILMALIVNTHHNSGNANARSHMLLLGVGELSDLQTTV